VTAAAVLPYGPLTPRTVHLCIDMQRMFAEDTPWHTPWMARVLPVVRALAAHRPAQTIFTRFMPPERAAQVPGSWRRYFERWHALTRAEIDPALLELLPALADLVPPAAILDKRTYSAFFDRRLLTELHRRGADSLVISGGETDVCVLATVLGAVDHGFRVVLPEDALCSSSDTTHDALMTLYGGRFAEQIEVASAETILGCWL